MKDSLQIVLPVLIVLTFSCSHQDQKMQKETREVVTINMTSPSGGNPVCIDDLLVNLSFVHLQDSVACYIIEASRIKVHKNRIYIFDQKQNKLFIFKENGDFITQAITKGKGPGEVTNAVDFDIDTKRDLLLVLDPGTPALLVYNLDGNYLLTIKLEFYSQHFACLDDETYSFYIGFFDPSYNNLRLTTPQGQTKYELFPFPKEVTQLTFSFSGFVTRNQSGILYNAACSNEIYQVTGDGKSKLKYKIDFGGKAWPESKKYDFQGFLQRMGQFDMDYLLNGFEENADALILHYQSGHRNFRAYYVKKSKSLYLPKINLVNDLFYNVLSNPRGIKDGNLFISVLEPTIVRDKIVDDQKSGKTVKMNARLKAEILSSKDFSNVILLFYSLKTR